MPTIIVVAGFRVMVRSADHPPAHVHVTKAGCKVKIDLLTLDVVGASTMTRHEQTKALAIVQAHREVLLGIWREIHG
jgi:hypothetical protein